MDPEDNEWLLGASVKLKNEIPFNRGNMERRQHVCILLKSLRKPGAFTHEPRVTTSYIIYYNTMREQGVETAEDVINLKECQMEAHVIKTKMRKSGYLELKNLPFEKGTAIEISISKKEKRENFQDLIDNDHVWTDDDIQAVERGRTIINQWKIS